MTRGEGPRAEQRQSFIAFWLFAGASLLVIGIAMFAAVRHGHRVGALIAFLGVVCLGIGFLVRRAGREREIRPR
jgi:heme A synthase